jgi:hypothetical protein
MVADGGVGATSDLGSLP